MLLDGAIWKWDLGIGFHIIMQHVKVIQVKSFTLHGLHSSHMMQSDVLATFSTQLVLIVSKSLILLLFNGS